MPDDWELAHGLNPTNAFDAVMDSDCDGRSNLEEYRAGTDPLQFDQLRIMAAQLRSPNSFELTVHSAIGKLYNVETSSNLVDWLPLSTFICSEDNQIIRTP